LDLDYLCRGSWGQEAKRGMEKVPPLFPNTRHSLISGARHRSPPLRAFAQEELAALYWKPIYKYLRLKWHASEEDAQDLTQGFFLPALNGDFLRRYDKSKAKFRTYLRMSLDRFVVSQRRAASRLKRGGGAVAHLDFKAAENELCSQKIPEGADMEDYLHREWTRSFFGAAVERLRHESATSGKEVQFALFERYDIEGQDGNPPSYAELAKEYKLPVTQVTNYLAFARRQFRRIILEQLAQLTGSDDQLREEARDLLGIELP
jgi:DNA-directed RNA polymerase specialized sigma24 family protein